MRGEIRRALCEQITLVRATHELVLVLESTLDIVSLHPVVFVFHVVLVIALSLASGAGNLELVKEGLDPREVLVAVETRGLAAVIDYRGSEM